MNGNLKLKLKEIVQQLLRSPKEFPVEALMGLAFFGIAFWHTETLAYDSAVGSMVSGVNADILWLFVPLVVLTFWLGKVNRWAYVASGFLFLPLMALNLKPFLWTCGFAFTYVLAAILLVVGTRKMDNCRFASHALHVVTQLFFGLVISALLYAAVLAILTSFFYIFGIDHSLKVYRHIFQFIAFFIAPQVCCTLISQREEDGESEPAKVLRLILNFILSPAIIVYTVILYAYFIKIVFTWDLPKGGVAWMVMGFVTVALVGYLAQYVLVRRYFDWFYRHLTWVTLPPLILYWVGSIYRIRLYSFTESRFYLLVAGVLMTLFVVMLLWKRTRRFQWMALILGAAIIVFTYIPGISAKSIGLRCQKERLKDIVQELKLVNAQTGKFVEEIDMPHIKRDSLLCERYQEACSIISYVRSGMGYEEFEAHYGIWDKHEYEFHFERQSNPMTCTVDRTHPVNLGEYTILLPSEELQCRYDNGVMTVYDKGKRLIEYPIGTMVRDNPKLLSHPESLLSYRNDSLLVVFDYIGVDEKNVTSIGTYHTLLFKKRAK